ncbi:MAG TPA: PilZ domain-containing protein [Candidatus Acidoferrum sp.]|nr:PilZ domain-containing protein [Candidatus Acidoferrum sp.]
MSIDSKERRRYQRVLVPLSHAIVARVFLGGKNFDGVVSVIGLGGMFIRTRETIALGTVLQVALTDPITSFDSECAVRACTQTGIGLEIISIDPAAAHKLQFLLRQLKR